MFSIIDTAEEHIVFQLKLSILQIYKEIIYDLLTGEKDLKVKENPVKGIYVDGLTEVFIDSKEAFLDYLNVSQQQRIVSGTKLNQYSSRSHSILILEVTSTSEKENFSKKGILNLVDLAGSEKVSKTGAVGETLEEAKKINSSLSALGNVIHSLTGNSDKAHVPYRDSKLTRILQESLGGNYKTTLIVTCSPHSYHFEETVSSLKFAQRAKSIKNKAKINIKVTYEELQKINTNLKSELELKTQELDNLKELIQENKIYNKKKTNPIKIQSALMDNQSLLLDQEINLDNINNDINNNCNDLKCKETFFEIKKLKDEIDNFKIELQEKEDNIKNLNSQVEEFQQNVKLLENFDLCNSLNSLSKKLKDLENLKTKDFKEQNYDKIKEQIKNSKVN